MLCTHVNFCDKFVQVEGCCVQLHSRTCYVSRRTSAKDSLTRQFKGSLVMHRQRRKLKKLQLQQTKLLLMFQLPYSLWLLPKLPVLSPKQLTQQLVLLLSPDWRPPLPNQATQPARLPLLDQNPDCQVGPGRVAGRAQTQLQLLLPGSLPLPLLPQGRCPAGWQMAAGM